jgi:Mg/Co/Ni transporter MgtE
MNRLAASVCKAFIDKCPLEKRAHLLKFLPQEDQQMLHEQGHSYKDPTLGLQSSEDYLKQIHPSWLATLLRMLPKNEIELFLSSLPAKQVDELKKLLLYSNHLAVLSSKGRAFLQNALFNKLKEGEILPLECLPHSPLNMLASLNLAQLQRLIQFLGLHDLALEMKQIIETARLKQIQASLTAEEQHYIKKLMQKKEPVSFKKMTLSNWKGDTEALKSALEKRGLNRLAKALYGQDPSLIWYVKHHLDTDRAETLQALCTSLDSTDASRQLVDQVVSVISHLHLP